MEKSRGERQKRLMIEEKRGEGGGVCLAANIRTSQKYYSDTINTY